MQSSSTATPWSLTIPNDPTTSSGPLTPENVNLTHSAPEAPKEDDRPLSPTMFTNGRDPVNISAEHLKNHPLHEPTGTSEVLTFYPTLKEFDDFSRYMKKIEAVRAHLACGICKVVAPEGWSSRPSKRLGSITDYSDADDYEILSPSRETIEATQKPGVYSKKNVVCKKKMSVREFKAMALSPKYRNPKPELTGAEMEKYYFDNITRGEPIYGADTEGTFYDEDTKEFNMKNLGTVLNEVNYEIKGVNTVYLYFGMYKTTFPWHAEDMDLYSINYLHFGAPKYWFAISSEHADRFERFMTQQYSYNPETTPQCRAFLRHKTCLVTPELLRAANIPYATMIQRPNEFIITFPRGYHMGFNQGYNLAESTNFATDRWIDYGKDAILCDCRQNTVKIEMRHFMAQYRKKEVELWYFYWYGGGRMRWAPQKKKDIPKKRRHELALAIAAKRARAAAANNEESSSDGSGSEAEGSSFMKSLPGYTIKNYQERPDYEDLMRKFKRETKCLRSNYTIDLFQEKLYNKDKQREWPHCSVCQFFQPIHMTAIKNTVPHSSRRLIPSLRFAKTNNEDVVENETIDNLLTCSNCNVTVHSMCCSGDQPDADQPWKCPRCRNRTDIEIRQASCQLCELRGGALIPCQIGKDITWAHVICALFNRRAVFDRPEGPTSCCVEPCPRQYSETTAMPLLEEKYRSEVGDLYEHSRWECYICNQIHEGLIPCTLCLKDYPSDIPTLAHVTCARRIGYTCEIRDYPLGTAMICHKHEHSTHVNRVCNTFSTLKNGDTVYVEDDSNDSNGKTLIKGEVINSVKKTAVAVDFLENSGCTDNREEDILSCECVYCENGDHQYGVRVKVLWDDKKTYDAYYRGKGKMADYTVRLDDGRVVNHFRSKLRTKRELNSMRKNM
uniref:[histone H3]-trimethyl-L-lysine(9) demethylase n=1 Tax=Caenorhabditis tropicalis TaxID=1561998 RepID=A0A1I7TSF1_9PELO